MALSKANGQTSALASMDGPQFSELNPELVEETLGRFPSLEVQRTLPAMADH